MYTRSAAFYDALYSWKNYQAESEQLHTLISKHRAARSLLDVGCGNGGHIPFLRPWYSIEALDLEAGMVDVVRDRYPDVPVHQADMADFHLEGRFDVVVSLFSCIGYVLTRPRLHSAIACMARHTVPGGLVIVEPWFEPGGFHPGRLHSLVVDQTDLKITRMNVSSIEPGETNEVSILDFHYLVGTPTGIEYFTERHELALFTEADMRSAFEAAGLDVHRDPDGLTGRSLYLGTK